MNKQSYFKYLDQELQKLKESGLYKQERIIHSPQQALIAINSDQTVLNLCANNYLGLANHPALIETARAALEQYGYGMSSVRFICGTQNIHIELEKKLSEFLKTEDTILYSSCFDANTGLFETLLFEEDAVISDSLNHASIIDGIRLCKAKRFRYQNNDMQDLEQKLEEAQAQNARVKLIATDGVFSMDGSFAKLPEICDLADKYQALVMVDDSHAVGFVGEQGRGTHEFWKVMNRIDILTGTMGKALGGASGGYTSGKKEIISWLRQRSRPYLFSNTVSPVITATSLKVLDLLQKDHSLKQKLIENAEYFRNKMTQLKFKLLPGHHPIIPIMIGDAKLAAQFADELLKENVYVISFSYPVVPLDQARIRTQMSASHSREELDHAIAAFEKIGKSLNLIPK